MGGVGSGKLRRGQGLVRVRVPKKPRLGWIDRADKRTQVYRRIVARLAELTEHLGGADELTAVERTLVERLVHVEALASRAETAVRAGKQLTPFALSQYFGAVDKCVQLSKLLGLQRRAREAGSLATYARDLAKQTDDANAN